MAKRNKPEAAQPQELTPKEVRLRAKQREHDRKLYTWVGGTIALALLLLAIGAIYAFFVVPNRSFASVGDQSISTRNFWNRMRLEKSSLVSRLTYWQQLEQQFGKQTFIDNSINEIQSTLSSPFALASQTLNTVLEEFLVNREAKTRNITVSEEDVTVALREEVANGAGLITEPQATGTAVADATATAEAAVTPTAEAIAPDAPPAPDAAGGVAITDTSAITATTAVTLGESLTATAPVDAAAVVTDTAAVTETAPVSDAAAVTETAPITPTDAAASQAISETAPVAAASPATDTVAVTETVPVAAAEAVTATEPVSATEAISASEATSVTADAPAASAEVTGANTVSNVVDVTAPTDVISPTATPEPIPTRAIISDTGFTEGQKSLETNLQSVANVSLAQYKEIKRLQLLRDKLKEEISKEVPKTEKQVKARHILLREILPTPTPVITDTAAITPTETVSRTMEQAMTQAKELKARIDAGEDFSQLAAQYSEDPGSAMQGGDLGWFREGAMVAEFNNVAFSLQPGQVSEPFTTTYGVHIIKLDEKDDNHPKDEQTLQTDQNKAYDDWLQKQLAGEDVKRPDDLITNLPRDLK